MWPGPVQSQILNMVAQALPGVILKQSGISPEYGQEWFLIFLGPKFLNK